jgi:hypothetical protein
VQISTATAVKVFSSTGTELVAPFQCTEGETLTLELLTDITTGNGGTTRYDIGIWVNPFGNEAQSNSDECLKYFVPVLGDDKVNDTCLGTTDCPLDGDICGDLDPDSAIAYGITKIPECQYGDCNTRISVICRAIPVIIDPFFFSFLFLFIYFF